MSAPGNNSVVTTGSNDAVVELATNDYLACLGVDEYFHVSNNNYIFIAFFICKCYKFFSYAIEFRHNF